MSGLNLPLTMGDALDEWLRNPDPDPKPYYIDPRVCGFAWWLLRTGPLLWRGYVVSATTELTVQMTAWCAAPLGDYPAAFMVPIPAAWNDGGVQW